MGMVEAFTTAWRKSFEYEGKATRAEFWWFYLANFIASMMLSFIFFVASFKNVSIFPPTSLYFFGQIFPSSSVSVRRIRDTGKGWEWILMPLVPFVGGILFFILVCQPSDTYLQEDRFI